MKRVMVIFPAFVLFCLVLTKTCPAQGLFNLSARGVVQTGDEIMIAGFTVQRAGASRIFILARGPSLAGFGISNSLADPMFTVKDALGNTVAQSDNWTGESQVSEIETIPNLNAGLPDPMEPAVVLDLEQGGYTVLVEGAGGATGVATVEIFDITGLTNGWVDPATGMEFVWVHGGCYQMGCWHDPDDESALDTLTADTPQVRTAQSAPTPKARPACMSNPYCDSDNWCVDHELPAHPVCVDGFYLGKYEVTQAQWETVMGNNPSLDYISDIYGGCISPDCPVDHVNINDIETFMNALGAGSGAVYRLPTEAQWEFAARSRGKYERYPGSENPMEVAWFSNDYSAYFPNPVGAKKQNSLGIYDMAGNVSEVCRDFYSRTWFAESPVNNPTGPLSGQFGDYRVEKGGHYATPSSGCRTHSRSWRHADDRWAGGGFRLVAQPPQ